MQTDEIATSEPGLKQKVDIKLSSLNARYKELGLAALLKTNVPMGHSDKVEHKRYGVLALVSSGLFGACEIN